MANWNSLLVALTWDRDNQEAAGIVYVVSHADLAEIDKAGRYFRSHN